MSIYDLCALITLSNVGIYRNNFNFVHIVNGHHWYFYIEE